MPQLLLGSYAALTGCFAMRDFSFQLPDHFGQADAWLDFVFGPQILERFFERSTAGENTSNEVIHITRRIDRPLALWYRVNSAPKADGAASIRAAQRRLQDGGGICPDC